MRRIAMLLVGVGGAAVAVAWPAKAEIVNGCGPRDEIIAKWGREFGESVVKRAITASGDMIEWLESPAGSFTVIVTGATPPPLQACVRSSGRDAIAVTGESGDPA